MHWPGVKKQSRLMTVIQTASFSWRLFMKRETTRRKRLQIVQKALQKNVITQELLLERARLVYQVNGAAAALPLLKELDTAYPEQVPVLKLLAQAEMEVGNLVQCRKDCFPGSYGWILNSLHSTC